MLVEVRVTRRVRLGLTTSDDKGGVCVGDINPPYILGVRLGLTTSASLVRLHSAKLADAREHCCRNTCFRSGLGVGLRPGSTAAITPV